MSAIAKKGNKHSKLLTWKQNIHLYGGYKFNLRKGSHSFAHHKTFPRSLNLEKQFNEKHGSILPMSAPNKNFIRNKTLKSTSKGSEAVRLQNPSWELFPWEETPGTEGFAQWKVKRIHLGMKEIMYVWMSTCSFHL